MKQDHSVVVGIRERTGAPGRIGLYELARFAQLLDIEPLSVWLGVTPFIYEILLYIPKRDCTLFNTGVYDVAAGGLTVHFMDEEIRLCDVEEIARHVMNEMSIVWMAEEKPPFNTDLVMRRPLTTLWKSAMPTSIAALSVEDLLVEGLSESVL
jgi:hypothetical protein